MTFDVAIIGAGIVGCACALEFSRAGLRTVVIESRFPGAGATAAGMGHIVVMDDSEAQFALTSYSRHLWNELAPELPSSVEFLSTGTIWVAADEEEMVEVHRKRSFYADRGVRTEVLDPQSLAKAEPNLRGGLAGGLLVPEDGVIYPPCAARYFLSKSGAHLQIAHVLRIEGDKVHLTDNSSISAGIIVNATGIQASQLTPALPVRIEPRKGHLVITDRYPGFVRSQLVELGYLKSAHSMTAESVAFNVQPRLTGQLLIGSSRQFGSTDPAIDRNILSSMLQRAGAYLPALGRLSAIRAWTGFRAATPDKLPLIGRSPESKNVFLATGHEGLGITTSLGTARLLAAQALGFPPAIPAEPYRPERIFTHA